MHGLVDDTDIASAAASRPARTTAWLWFGRLGVLACMGLYVALTRAFTWQLGPVDDAYITFRYAAHLTAGHGLVFNPGEHVEGYTSASWVLLMAALDALGFDLATASRGAGVLLGLGSLAIVAWMSRQLATGLWACLALATALPAISHFSNGLETALMTTLLTLFVSLRTRGSDTAARRAGEACVVALLTWTRPEGAACCAWWLIVERCIRRERAPAPWLHVAVAAAGAFALQTSVRFIYYGDWIATSARAKLLPLAATLPRGLADLAAFVVYATCGGILAVAAVFAVERALRARADDAVHVLRIAAFASGALVLLAASGGDSYGLWRFYVPVLPCLCWLGARGIVLACEAIQTALRSPAAAWIAQVVVIASCAVVRVNSNETLRPELSSGWERHWHAIGLAFRREVPPETRVALCPAGIIPYLSGLYAIDILGLTDPAIARAAPDLRYWLPGHQRHDGGHVLDRKPDMILLANGSVVDKPTRAFPWDTVRIYERDIVDDPRFERDYALAHVRLPTGKFVQVHVRKDFVRR